VRPVFPSLSLCRLPPPFFSGAERQPHILTFRRTVNLRTASWITRAWKF
jgi:hypothetical protein